MAPTKPDNKRKSWSEMNKTRREEKRKTREENLKKKLAKNVEQIQSEALDSKIKAESEKVVQNPAISTLSIAVPGSILENAQSQELRTYLAGQIARAACIFQVDEVVIFDDYADEPTGKKSTLSDDYGLKTARQSCVQLGRILQYLECPQYLRKSFFPIHNDLKFCGILNPLNAPHHLAVSDQFRFREGVVLNKPVKKGKGSIVNVGLYNEVHVDKELIPGVRCTVKLLPQEPNTKKLKGLVVLPNVPRLETGVYWGYKVRIATSLATVFSQCPYKDGYDLTVGTSDKGSSVDEFECPKFKHLLIMFGGLQGLEAALENDEILNADDPKLLFDYYLNTLPNQGSKTIRTEEAILVSLAALRLKLNPENVAREYVEGSNNIIYEESSPQKKKEAETVSDDMSRFD